MNADLLAAARRAGSLEEFYTLVKSKRYALARIRRLALYAFLDLRAPLPERPPYLRVLGMSAMGEAILRQAALCAEAAGNLVVVKTHVGMGSAVGAAVDAMPQVDCVGTLAGDDTLLIVARTAQDASEICGLLTSLIAKETD